MDSSRPVHEGILILDYGSQYTLLIARRLREAGVYTEVIDGTQQSPPEGFEFKGIILSGGPDSVQETEARSLPVWVLESNVPVLGICYGMQLLAQGFGGKLRSGGAREYGKATLNVDLGSNSTANALFAGISHELTVWMSHGDDVEGLPNGFEKIGITDGNVVTVICHKEKPYIGLQFHPEVHHTESGGSLLKNFANICQASLNWEADCMLESSIEHIRTSAGRDAKVLMAVSGGVDSSVAAALLTKALGKENVTGVFVDHGLLRKNEVSWVSENLQSLGVDLVILDKKKEFYSALEGVSDPEEKRKIIGRKFIECFEAFAKERKGFTHLGQGTLYPDVIESAGHEAGAKVIKSHHYVGGLPERLALKLIEPFRFFFKDEVRKIGLKIGVEEALIRRHPFPGPGLGVRILGEISPEKVRILQEADDIFIKGLYREGFYDSVWQAFAVLLPVKTVGVMGDNRTYQWTCAVRAVSATDGMTAGVSDLPMEFLVSISDEIVRKVDGINRVVYDITTKPPATIEWE